MIAGIVAIIIMIGILLFMVVAIIKETDNFIKDIYFKFKSKRSKRVEANEKMEYSKDTMPDGTIYERYEGTPEEIGTLILVNRMIEVIKEEARNDKEHIDINLNKR